MKKLITFEGLATNMGFTPAGDCFTRTGPEFTVYINLNQASAPYEIKYYNHKTSQSFNTHMSNKLDALDKALEISNRIYKDWLMNELKEQGCTEKQALDFYNNTKSA